METNFEEISVKGKLHRVPAACIGGRTIIVTGNWLKISELHDEHWRAESVQDAETVVEKLKTGALKADIFTFAQKLPETAPKFNYPLEWDNVAAIPLTSFNDWWEKRLPQETRKNVRRAGRRGVVTRPVVFDRTVAEGLKRIYDETPIRQGRRFWHYGKDVETIKQENSSYFDRSEFIGAYCGEELIGLLKMVYIGKTASIMQIISQNKHYDKRPANALLAKAVEICAQKGMTYFIYGQYVYGNNDGPLTEFKRRNGFEQFLLPRYYIPLTLKGRIALKLKLHLGLRRFLPRKLETVLLDLRAKAYEKTATKKSDVGTNALKPELLES